MNRTSRVKFILPKWWPRTLQARLLWLLVVLMVCYGVGLVAIRQWHSQEISRMLTQEVVTTRQIFDRMRELRGQSLYTFAYDYTYWDEMVDFVAQPDSEWTAANIDPSLDTYDANAVWIFDPQFEPVYFVSNIEDESLRDLPELKYCYRKIFAREPFAHFFVKTDSGLLEIRGATIHPSEDNDRKTSPKGYFYVARFWNDELLTELGGFVEGAVQILPLTDPRASDNGTYDKHGLITWSQLLPAWNGHPVTALYIEIDSEEVEQHLRTADFVHALNLALAAALLAVLTWIIVRSVVRPLRRIAASLDSENLAHVEPLFPEPTEFGHISRLIRGFFEQRDDLLAETEQRRRAENALRLTQFSIENANTPIYWIDPEGRIIDSNAAAQCLDQYTAEEFKSLTVFDLDPAVPPEAWPKIWSDLCERKTLTFESQHLRKDGQLVPVEITASYLDYEGKAYSCTFVRDITERKQAERDREVLEGQLRRVQRLETIGTLAGGIAHDFNNILTPILGYADMILARLGPGNPVTGDVQEISKAAFRARDLVKQILSFSRQGDSDRKPVRLHHICHEALGFLRASFPATIEIHEDLDRNSDPVLCDPSQIHQVFMNLCTNASQAIGENKGIIEIGLDSIVVDAELACLHVNLNEGKYVRLTVSDTGCGMDRATSERIFEPFFTTKKVGEGTGLGLAVVHGIVMSHGGGITVYSEPDKGSTFRVYLPAAPAVDDIGEIVESPTDPGSERILFVDDEQAITHMGKDMLERLGYSVSTFTSSLDALEAFRRERNDFDLVITDQTMPHMTGDQLAKELLLMRPDIPIILITGFTQRVSATNYKRLGIREFVMKPLVIRDLSTAIRRALAREVDLA